jgi:hypothetical protein
MKTTLIENTSTTSSPVMQDFLGGEYHERDYLCRFQSDSRSTISVAFVTKTHVVRDGLNAYFDKYTQDVELLCSVIFWQKRTIDYQALHTAFLLNSLSEDEFEQEAEKFIVHQKSVPPETIASVVERIDSLTGLKFDTSDYADYFRCSQQNVMDGLQELRQHPHFAAMLPTSAEEQ